LYTESVIEIMMFKMMLALNYEIYSFGCITFNVSLSSCSKEIIINITNEID